MDETLPPVLKPGEVAKLCRISLNNVYALVKSGELPARHFGKAIRIPRSAVADLLP